MNLVSISVGKTQRLDINGQNVETAYLKSPISGPVQVTDHGLEGNEVAVHTDAIYAIAQEHYPYWAGKLNADPGEWGPGHFAENLTISGIPEDKLCVGDELAVGEGVRLTVSGPRIPCFKLCWRFGQPDTFIREFALSGKSGVYFNVKSTGVIQPGDTVRLVGSSTGGVKIHDIARIAFGDLEVELETLEHILGLPGLSATCALLLRNKLFQLKDGERVKKDRWEGWRSVRVEQIIEETPEIKSFHLIAEDERPLAPYRAGQFLTVRLPDNTDDSKIRVWSLSDFDDHPSHYRLSIKKEPNGLGGSRFMHKCIAEGASLEIKPPLGQFVLDRGSFRPRLMIAGGIGVTPLLSMLKAHVDMGADAPPLYFIHCCRSRSAQPFRSELDELAKSGNVEIVYVFDSPEDDENQGEDYDHKGFLSLSHIEDFMAGCHIIHGGKRIDMPWFDCDIYMCGPPVFQEKLVAALIEAGGNRERIFQESFEATGNSTGALAPQTATVEFSISGIIAEWRADEDLSLLELAEARGLQPGNACRMGVCQSCAVKVTEGSVQYKFAPTHSPAAGTALLCCARPSSEKVILEI